jgi:hypothetical protein
MVVLQLVPVRLARTVSRVVALREVTGPLEKQFFQVAALLERQAFRAKTLRATVGCGVAGLRVDAGRV